MLTEPISAPVRQERFRDLRSRFQTARAPRVEPCIPTSIAELDELLGGGLPAGVLVTLEGPVSSGRWSIAACLLAQATRRGLGAVIDDGALYPPSLAAAGVRLERLMVVPAKTPVGIARAVDMILRSRAAQVVVMSAVALRAAVWARFAHLAHRFGIVLVVIAVRAAGELTVNAALRLACGLEHVALCGTRGVWCTFAGFSIRAQLRKNKSAIAGAAARLRVMQERVSVRLREVDRHAALRAGSSV
jgi:hypothetical protein